MKSGNDDVSSIAILGANYEPHEITDAFVSAVQEDIEARQQQGLPVVKYDTKRKQAYLEHPDGRRDYVNKPK